MSFSTTAIYCLHFTWYPYFIFGLSHSKAIKPTITNIQQPAATLLKNWSLNHWVRIKINIFKNDIVNATRLSSLGSFFLISIWAFNFNTLFLSPLIYSFNFDLVYEISSILHNPFFFHSSNSLHNLVRLSVYFTFSFFPVKVYSFSYKCIYYTTRKCMLYCLVENLCIFTKNYTFQQK